MNVEMVVKAQPPPQKHPRTEAPRPQELQLQASDIELKQPAACFALLALGQVNWAPDLCRTLLCPN